MILTLPEAKTLPVFIMSSLLLSKTDVSLKFFFAHNVRYGNFVNFRIGVTLESLQYLDNLQPQPFDFVLNASQLIEFVINSIIT